uniref:Uncharacterized protein n=1 Tax=Physcomitrium patens TaxID=3218 RepID=A0A2K1KL52_PHYPA|nr:hypothetical protein PHYPA_008174 [Physcomitrium patens]
MSNVYMDDQKNKLWPMSAKLNYELRYEEKELVEKALIKRANILSKLQLLLTITTNN